MWANQNIGGKWDASHILGDKSVNNFKSSIDWPFV